MNDIPLSELRILCTAKYLSLTLGIGFNKGFQACRKYNRYMDIISLTSMKQNVDYLKNEFKYSNVKVVNYGLFLIVNTENLKKFFTHIKPVIGNYLFSYLVTFPHILKMDHLQILNNYNTIKEKCDGKFFTRSVPLLSINSKQLKSTFDQIEKNEDISRLNLHHFGVDLLALNFQKLLERLNKLKSEQIPLETMPISFLFSTDSEFECALMDLTSDPELRICFFLKSNFDLDYNKIKHR